MIRIASLLAILPALSACSGYEDEGAQVDTITQSEAEALDDAAEMIDQRRLPEGTLPDEAEPAPRESGGPAPMELPDE